MSLSHSFRFAPVTQCAYRLRCLVLSHADAPAIANRLEALGAQVECEAELYTGLAAAIDDPHGYDLVLIDCDSFADSACGSDHFDTLRAEGSSAAVLFMSHSYLEQSFPDLRRAPMQLRSPGTSLSLRLALEHTIQERKIWQAA